MHARTDRLERVGERRDGGERIVLHAERGERILRLRRALGHDEGHRLSDVGDDLLRQYLRTHGSKQARMRDEEGEPAERRHVGGHEHVRDPGASPRRLGIDLHDARVGMQAAVDGDVEHPGERHVGNVPAVARDQPRVLAAAHARPEEPLAHEVSPSPLCRAPSARDAQLPATHDDVAPGCAANVSLAAAGTSRRNGVFVKADSMRARLAAPL